MCRLIKFGSVGWIPNREMSVGQIINQA